MRSTYSRVMSGSGITGPPIRRRWAYLAVVVLLVGTAFLARSELVDLVTQPTGIAALIAVATGFAVKDTMALTPWWLVSGALMVYGIGQGTEAWPSVMAGAQLALLVAAGASGLLQSKVRLVEGRAASQPSRARWGSVLVTTTACLVVVVLSRPDVALRRWTRDEPPSRQQPGIARADFGRVTLAGRLQDPAIVESSGLVASRRNPGALWTHNDSGNAPALYCLQGDGSSCGTWAVEGAGNEDWEDIAVGPGPDSKLTYLYIGDVGDNASARDSITVYRVPEPSLPTNSSSTSPAESLTFEYPDGPHDAEALLVHPDSGALYVITKEVVSGVYKATPPFVHSSPMVLEKIASFSIFGSFADRTGADISPDGRHVALSTYGGWYELVLPSRESTQGFDAIWTTTPSRIGTNIGPQWEAIAYAIDGGAVYMTSEGAGTGMYEARR